MMRTSLCAAMLAVGACTAEPADSNYLAGGGSTAAPMAGAAGQPMLAAGTTSAGSGGMGAAGLAAAGTGGAMAGTTAAGSGGQAGSEPVPAGTGGQAGSEPIAGQDAAGSGGAPVAGTSGGNTEGTVTVEFTTVSYGGEYAPKNYGAVWFEEPGGAFIKTAKRWAGTVHATDLVGWTEASTGWGSIFGGGNAADMMDAVSSATLQTHQMHTVTWNMKDVDTQLVPDGEYVAVVEMTESRARDLAGPVIRIEFTKGPSPQMVEMPDEDSFTGIVLRYEP